MGKMLTGPEFDDEEFLRNMKKAFNDASTRLGGRNVSCSQSSHNKFIYGFFFNISTYTCTITGLFVKTSRHPSSGILTLAPSVSWQCPSVFVLSAVSTPLAHDDGRCFALQCFDRSLSDVCFGFICVHACTLLNRGTPTPSSSFSLTPLSSPPLVPFF